MAGLYICHCARPIIPRRSRSVFPSDAGVLAQKKEMHAELQMHDPGSWWPRCLSIQLHRAATPPSQLGGNSVGNLATCRWQISVRSSEEAAATDDEGGPVID